MNLKLLLILIAILGFSLCADAQIISTLVGTGTYGDTGDGGPAINAECHPAGLWVDRIGTVYFADDKYGRIRRITTDGIITNVAGNGIRHYDDDGSPATDGDLTGPRHLTMDNYGNMYITDPTENRVRMIDAYGIIHTLAGGAAGYDGNGGLATYAHINSPAGIAVDDSSNVYFSEENNDVIRKIDKNGIISTYAGKKVRGFNGDNIMATDAYLDVPQGIALDKWGNLYVADAGNNRIRKISTTGIISTVAGNGTLPADYNGDNIPATDANLYIFYNGDVAVDSTGNIYIPDIYNHRVRMVNGAGIITTIAGTGVYGYSGDGGAPTMAMLHDPVGVGLSSNGFIYISDIGNARIRYIYTPVGVPNVAANDNGVSIVPNPSNGHFAVHMAKDVAGSANVSLINVLGQVVYSKQGVKGKNIAVDADVPPGSYWLKLCNTNGEVYGGRVSVIK